MPRHYQGNRAYFIFYLRFWKSGENTFATTKVTLWIIILSVLFNNFYNENIRHISLLLFVIVALVYCISLIYIN